VELILHYSSGVYGVHRVNFVSNRTQYLVTSTEQVSFYRFDCPSFGIPVFPFPYCFFFLCSPCRSLFFQPTAYLITYASTHFRFVLTLTKKNNNEQWGKRTGGLAGSGPGILFRSLYYVGPSVSSWTHFREKSLLSTWSLYKLLLMHFGAGIAYTV